MLYHSELIVVSGCAGLFQDASHPGILPACELPRCSSPLFCTGIEYMKEWTGLIFVHPGCPLLHKETLDWNGHLVISDLPGIHKWLVYGTVRTSSNWKVSSVGRMLMLMRSASFKFALNEVHEICWFQSSSTECVLM